MNEVDIEETDSLKSVDMKDFIVEPEILQDFEEPTIPAIESPVEFKSLLIKNKSTQLPWIPEKKSNKTR